MNVIASNFRPMARNTLKGFIDIALPDVGLVIRETAWHEKEGQEWVSPPGRPMVDKEGLARRDQESGKVKYVPVVEFTTKEARNAFSAAAVKAAYKLLGGGEDKARVVADASPLV